MVKHQNWTRIAFRNEQTVIEPWKHVEHAKVENFTKSLILGSRDSFSSNFNIFEKNNSNHLTLWPQNPKILGNVPCFHPGENFFILTLYTHRQSLDWPLISILTSQSIHKTCSSPWKTSYMFSIYEKTVNCKTSWKESFGSYRVPLQIRIDIGPMSSTLCAVNGRFVFQSENGQLLEWP